MKSLVIFATLLCQALGQSCFDDYLIGTQATIKFNECKRPSNGKEIENLNRVGMVNIQSLKFHNQLSPEKKSVSHCLVHDDLQFIIIKQMHLLKLKP